MKTIEELTEWVVRWRQDKGFYTPDSFNTQTERDMMLGKLMLIVTEVAEAAEAVRHEDLDNFKEELADIAIRLFDIAGTMSIDLEDVIVDKMKVNEKRPFQHGKACGL